MKIAIGKPSGARKRWTKNMLTVIGKSTTVANGTKKPATNAIPAIVSTAFKNGMN